MRLKILILLLLSTALFAQNNSSAVSGKVSNKSNGEPLSDCNVSVREISRGTTTDSSGGFYLHIPQGKYQIRFSHIGFETVIMEIELSSSGEHKSLKVEMNPSSIEESEVTVLGEKKKSTLERQKLDKSDIINMPTLYSDALRTVQILPGVTSNNELSSGYNVRGGNFDENLIYLNGFQIYRPFLLKQGSEENQTLLNPSMIRDLQFYNGSFPARLGDKMSSALEVTYSNEFSEKLSGSLKTDLLNLSASLNNKYKDLNWAFSFRYAYPGMFLNKLHTTGSYEPSFDDIQALLNYSLTQNSSLEAFAVAANNKYNFSPYEFDGNFQQMIDLARYYRGLKISFNGRDNYSFKTNLLGLTYKNNISGKALFSFSLSGYNTRENEEANTSADIYYIPDAYMPGEENEFLKSRFQSADNTLKLTSYEAQSSIVLKPGSHTIKIGAGYTSSKIESILNEGTHESGDQSLNETPFDRQISWTEKFNSCSLYAQDDISLGTIFRLNAGLRYLHYNFTGEDLFSPRASLFFYPSDIHSFNISWGYYYQPPFYYEYRNKEFPEATGLKSQRAIFYSLGWDYKFKEKVKFQLQTYYKKLDRLIPYYLEQLKLEYLDKNNMEGYAFGVDIQFQGEITKDVQSWIGYSYLDTKEREAGPNIQYLRRLLDQTHTIQIFLQDKFPKHPNWQSHLRLLFGSGFLYPERVSVNDIASGKSFIEVDLKDRSVFPFYMRADMGLTAVFKIFQDKDLKITVEVLNVFNKQNIANYLWIQTIKEIRQPVPIPQMYSERFFNLGAEISF